MSADSHHKATRMMAHMDTNMDGRIDQFEFCQAFPGPQAAAIHKFREIDTNASGYISRDELARALELEKRHQGWSWGNLPPRPMYGAYDDGAHEPRVSRDASRRAQRVLNEVDIDGDNHINREEFAMAWPGSRADALRRFAQIDRSKNGYISKRELAQEIQRQKSRGQHRGSMADDAFDLADTNGDGVVDQGEYNRAVNRGIVKRPRSSRAGFRNADRDGDGVLDRQEFRRENSMNGYDTGRGGVSRSYNGRSRGVGHGRQGARIARTSARESARERAEVKVDALDADGDGVVDRQEYIKAARESKPVKPCHCHF